VRILGLDLGTTSLSAVILDSETGLVCETRNVPNPGILAVGRQDCKMILDAARKLIEELHPQALGVTGQMHGLVYLDRKLAPVSPLYTWQDAGGDEPDGEASFAQNAGKLTGYPLASGYGLLTDWILRRKNEVPGTAAYMTTLPGALTAALTGEMKQHASMLASWGCFRGNAFDEAALERLETPWAMVPPVSEDRAVMEGPNGLRIAPAVGDNQASVLGSLPDGDCLLVNVGTGSQVSMLTRRPVQHPVLETRPYFDGQSLLVGASLCGGNTYAALEEFFRQVLEMANVPCKNKLYEAMEQWMRMRKTEPMLVHPQLDGSRTEPQLKGRIERLSRASFTPQGMIGGFLWGIAQDLLSYYRAMAPGADEQPRRLVASGNGIRLNPLLRDYISRAFGLPLVMTDFREEAALGAALYAGVCTGAFSGWMEASGLVRVQ